MKEIWFIVVPGVYVGTVKRAWDTSFAELFADHPEAERIDCIIKPERRKKGKP